MPFHVGDPVEVNCACEHQPCRHEGMSGEIAGQVGNELYTVKVTSAPHAYDVGERLVFDAEELRRRR